MFLDTVICEGLEYSMMTQLDACQLYTTTTTTTDRNQRQTSGAGDVTFVKINFGKISSWLKFKVRSYTLTEDIQIYVCESRVDNMSTSWSSELDIRESYQKLDTCNL